MTAPAGDTTTAPATETTGEPQVTEQPAEGVKLTSEQQAVVDAAIARRLREEKSRMTGEVERRVQEEIEKSKMDAAQRAEVERDEARKQAEEATTSSKRAVAEARVETALLAAGIKPQRLEDVAMLVKLDDVMGSDDPRSAAAEAVQKVLARFPEFRPTPGASGGELTGGGGGGSVTLEQFKGMDYDQRVEVYNKDAGLYKRLVEQERAA